MLQAKSKPKGIFCILMRGEISNSSYCNFIIIIVVCVIVYLAILALCFIGMVPINTTFISCRGNHMF